MPFKVFYCIHEFLCKRPPTFDLPWEVTLDLLKCGTWNIFHFNLDIILRTVYLENTWKVLTCNLGEHFVFSNRLFVVNGRLKFLENVDTQAFIISMTGKVGTSHRTLSEKPFYFVTIVEQEPSYIPVSLRFHTTYKIGDLDG